VSGSALRERRLGLLLCAPAVLAMLVVTAYPLLYAVWLSLFRYDLRFPDERAFVGLANYASVLTSQVWWRSLANTLLITAGSVTIELLLGFALALVMHRTLFGRAAVRAAALVPYAIITVVAALAWRFAFDPTTGFVHGLLGIGDAWLSERWSAFVVIIAAEVWKTTPFVALLLLAGLTLVPPDVVRAARVDGASAWQRLWLVTLPLMKPAILVALLFRTLDAFRIFDTVYVLTRGAQDTESVSVLAYQALIARLNLGLGAAVSVLIFIATAGIALLYLRAFRPGLMDRRGGTGARP
jgi:multiple sugar transport system permease protein